MLVNIFLVLKQIPPISVKECLISAEQNNYFREWLNVGNKSRKRSTHIYKIQVDDKITLGRIIDQRPPRSGGENIWSFILSNPAVVETPAAILPGLLAKPMFEGTALINFSVSSEPK